MSFNLAEKNIAQIHYDHFVGHPLNSRFEIPIRCPFIPDKIIFKTVRVSGIINNPGINDWATIRTNMFDNAIVATVANGFQLEGNTFTNSSRRTFNNETYNFILSRDDGSVYPDVDVAPSYVQLSICFIRYID
jgi:hypothetical protein